MKTIKIKGKDYVPVNERVIEFRKLHPTWSISTDILESSSEHCLMKVKVLDENKNLISEGIAYERQEWGGVNTCKYYENCQTSAVGRAMAFLGIGIDTAIASAEEMQIVTNIDSNKEKKQEITTWLTKEQKAEIETLIQEGKLNEAKQYVNKYSKAPLGMKRDWRDELVKKIKDSEII